MLVLVGTLGLVFSVMGMEPHSHSHSSHKHSDGSSLFDNNLLGHDLNLRLKKVLANAKKQQHSDAGQFLGGTTFRDPLSGFPTKGLESHSSSFQSDFGTLGSPDLRGSTGHDTHNNDFHSSFLSTSRSSSAGLLPGSIHTDGLPHTHTSRSGSDLLPFERHVDRLPHHSHSSHSSTSGLFPVAHHSGGLPHSLKSDLISEAKQSDLLSHSNIGLGHALTGRGRSSDFGSNDVLNTHLSTLSNSIFDDPLDLSSSTSSSFDLGNGLSNRFPDSDLDFGPPLHSTGDDSRMDRFSSSNILSKGQLNLPNSDHFDHLSLPRPDISHSQPSFLSASGSSSLDDLFGTGSSNFQFDSTAGLDLQSIGSGSRVPSFPLESSLSSSSLSNLQSNDLDGLDSQDNSGVSLTSSGISSFPNIERRFDSIRLPSASPSSRSVSFFDSGLFDRSGSFSSGDQIGSRVSPLISSGTGTNYFSRLNGAASSYPPYLSLGRTSYLDYVPSRRHRIYSPLRPYRYRNILRPYRRYPRRFSSSLFSASFPGSTLSSFRTLRGSYPSPARTRITF